MFVHQLPIGLQFPRVCTTHPMNRFRFPLLQFYPAASLRNRNQLQSNLSAITFIRNNAESLWQNIFHQDSGRASIRIQYTATVMDFKESFFLKKSWLPAVFLQKLENTFLHIDFILFFRLRMYRSFVVLILNAVLLFHVRIILICMIPQ